MRIFLQRDVREAGEIARIVFVPNVKDEPRVRTESLLGEQRHSLKQLPPPLTVSLGMWQFR